MARICQSAHDMMPIDTLSAFPLSLPAERPLFLNALALPAPLSIVVLAPHPDDFDAIGVTMRLLQRQGHALHVAVLTAGANGVEDGWNGARSLEEKAMLREAEQRASCAFFGLPEERLSFLRLWETNGEADDSRLRAYLLGLRPQLVFLPHGNDSNATHRRVYQAFDAIAREENLSLLACLNQDAKTGSMRQDIYMGFDKEDASWKARLLRFHRSQHERNLKTRGIGLDERVLRLNRQSAAAAGMDAAYAEAFELKRYG